MLSNQSEVEEELMAFEKVFILAPNSSTTSFSIITINITLTTTTVISITFTFTIIYTNTTPFIAVWHVALAEPDGWQRTADEEGEGQRRRRGNSTAEGDRQLSAGADCWYGWPCWYGRRQLAGSRGCCKSCHWRPARQLQRQMH